MSTYQYTQLPAGCIRILRLQPHQDKQSTIRCQLSSIELRDSEGLCLYEALSYVWGSPNKPHSIDIEGCSLSVGTNLYAALLRLRHTSLERFLWVDAVCINQTNITEKEQQIQLMAQIYAKARSVIVWLGEATTVGSEDALEEIRVAAASACNGVEISKPDEEPILEILKLPWFKRVWVLQEVAAARHVLVKFGRVEIDGYAFCTGIGALELSYHGDLDLQLLISPVLYLIRRAIFRPKQIAERSVRFSLDICPLSELVGMYHNRQATERHDKIYALFGMCSDDLDDAGLLVDYKIPWDRLLQKLVNYILPRCLSVSTWNDNQVAVIVTLAHVLGKVQSVEAREESQNVIIDWKTPHMEYHETSCWSIKASSKSAEVGDIVCLFDGCSMPTIIRLCGLNWVIVFISITPQIKPAEYPSMYFDTWNWANLVESLGKPSAKFELIWDLDMQQDQGNRPPSNVAAMSPTTTNSIQPSMAKDDRERAYVWLRYREKESLSEIEYRLREIVNKLDIATAISELDFHLSSVYFKESIHALQSILTVWEASKATKEVQDLMVKNELEIDQIIDALLGVCGGWLPLNWAIDDGDMVVAGLLLFYANPNAELGHGLTPLAWASESGNDLVVKLLIDTGKVDLDYQNKQGETPLLLAARRGYDTVVKKLLDTGNVDPNASNVRGDTPLLVAIYRNHVAVVKLLLETGKADPNVKKEHRKAI
ncbi:hypothetical protein FPSE_10641 [Fusarium pseudograminearum CS3096]|uniref:Heterokaryon incompatibility domain-containing protein n=1 Tax=Fusarium pseudograminearum (strain CS3096) TaxID=1028729 RepID=K3UCJ2_FUSPC|nr:hypothetical protein FPSE_10641 [Fusarium pseudograminearum CS3096]EKJ69176.1 hypothetical protein FPSE_10641 [Fusarium pseudograminearum CS3096]